MAIKTPQIVKILQLQGLGRKTAIKFCELSQNEILDNDNDLQEFLLECIDKNRLSRLPFYTSNEFKSAFDKAEEILYKSERGGIQILSRYDEDFPQALITIKDAPLILNFKGNYKALNELVGVAIIGTRNPTPEGVKSGEFFGNYYGKLGLNVVSGLAKGCDAAGHRGCLEAGGFTTAIVAHGLHTIYPAENKELAERIVSSGGVLLSEYFVGTSALANYFIERDRLQAGLSQATIVIQTGVKGGTLHAVNATIESKKVLGAVKYKTGYNEVIEGNEMLIRQQKAFPLTSENRNEFTNRFFLITEQKDSVKLEQKPAIIKTPKPEGTQSQEVKNNILRNADQPVDSYLENLADEVPVYQDHYNDNHHLIDGDFEANYGQDIENTDMGIDEFPIPLENTDSIKKETKPTTKKSPKKNNNQGKFDF